ncbi:hypothetical protein H0H93_009457, partial [Arthromyces matolae]
LLDTILQNLNTLNDADFTQVADSFPQPYLTVSKPDYLVPFNLPLVLVPPESDIELDGVATNTEEAAQIKKDEWPEYYLRLFDNEITPDPNTPAGYAVRTALVDTLAIFEVNRKDCARLLLEYPKWTFPGAFKPKPGASAEVEPIPGPNWQLESTLLEIILGTLLILPESPHKSIFYISLITELCKLSPSTVGPAVGKSIRKLYGLLLEGLDVEAARRFAEWFSIHMSNFGFQWVWKEWILKTLPEAMQAPEAQVVPEQAPGPFYIYEDSTNPHHDTAQGVLNLFRGRAKAEDVIDHVQRLRENLEPAEDAPATVDATVRSIVIQSLLSIGSRSFSHLLNAIERYLPLLRAEAALGGGSESKAGILTSSNLFWKYNPHMVGIVFDKLMQYQIVDPNDVVGWTFANGAGLAPGFISAFEWDFIRGALDKANGRVLIARRKVTALRKEEDDTRARAKASANESMEVDADTKPEEEMTVDNPALTTALKALDSLTLEQKSGLLRTLEGFVTLLSAANPHVQAVITEAAWVERANWTEDEWSAWETWAWYRQFCRAYSPYLREYAQTLYTVSFSQIEASTEPAAELLKKIWRAAVESS